jgi:hypothetical protein
MIKEQIQYPSRQPALTSAPPDELARTPATESDPAAERTDLPHGARAEHLGVAVADDAHTVRVKTPGFALALACTVTLVACASTSSPTPATSSTSRHAAARTQDVDPQLQRRLWELATHAARSDGGDVATAEAVPSTHATAVRVTMGDIVQGNQPVWVIQVQGRTQFVCNACSRPAGAAAPRGRFLTLVVDATTLQTLDDGIGPTGADLGQLGTVIDLHA